MRILILCNRTPWPLTDGGAIAMYNMIKGLYDQGQNVHLTCFNVRKHFVPINELPPLFKELKTFDTVEIDTSITRVGMLKNLFSKESYHISRFWSSKLADVIQRRCEEYNFDIIQIEQVQMAPYLSIVRRYSQAPVVLREHNVEYRIWERVARATKFPIKRYYLQILARRLKKFELSIVNQFDLLVTLTKEDADFFKKAGCIIPEYVSPIGLDMDNYTVDNGHIEWPSVFHLGSMSWVPNQQAIFWFLDEVWPKVIEKNKEAHFYIGGRNMHPAIYGYASSSVKIIEDVENAQAFISSKGIMVVPLQAGSGMRVKIIEGMALGKVIVSTTIGAEGIPAKNGIEIIIADKAEAFAAALLSLLNHRDEYDKIAQCARQFAKQHYDNKKVIAQLIALYQKTK